MTIAPAPIADKPTSLASYGKTPVQRMSPELAIPNVGSQPALVLVPKSVSDKAVSPTAAPSSTSILEESVSTGLVKPSSNSKGTNLSPTDLWDEAYKRLREDEPKVLKAYEDFLLDGKLERSGNRALLLDISNISGIERQKQLKQVLDSQQEVNKQKRWEFVVS